MKTLFFSFLMSICWSSLCCQTTDQRQTLKSLNEKLGKGELSLSDVLTERKWMPLHSMTAFREIIKQHAKAEKLRIAATDEPGLKTTVRCTALNTSGTPMANVLVYYYQTSDKGWYADTAAHVNMNEGDMRHARLFGYQKTDAAGQFEFETIRPRGYPRSDLPAHIHIHFWKENGEAIEGMPGELLFEEDDRLTPARKKEALRSGYLVSKNTGTEAHAVYEYRMVPERD